MLNLVLYKYLEVSLRIVQYLRQLYLLGPDTKFSMLTKFSIGGSAAVLNFKFKFSFGLIEVHALATKFS